MSRLYIFAIGGTGARVVKALTMLLASGVDANTEEIIPIMIDPHTANDDLRRTITQLEQYQDIYNTVSENGQNAPSGFFKTRIRTLRELSDSRDIANTFTFDLQNIKNEKFKQYIDLGQLDTANKALAELLFTEDALDTEMDIGFIGQPNIGSVVLNQFKDSKEFSVFANTFRPNDRIFIISSIFGGTGAAGFPLILKNIREAHNVTTNGVALQNPDYLKKSIIGAVTVLPYFSLATPTNSSNVAINSADFIPKTTAALRYYENNVTGNKSVNAMYYIGDEDTSAYNNDPGQGGQKNKAHFTELASALSIIDFLSIEDKLLVTNDTGQADRAIYKEFGVNADERTLYFSHLGQTTQNIIKKPLTQYLYFSRYLRDELQQAMNRQPFFKTSKPIIDASFTTSSFYTSTLMQFNRAFEEWLSEMAANQRKFAPFNLTTPQLSEVLNGIKPKQVGIFGKKDKKITFDDISSFLNSLNNTIYSSQSQKIVQGLFTATNALLKDFYNGFD